MESTTNNERYFEIDGIEMVQYEDIILPKYFLATFPNESVADKMVEVKSIPYNTGDVLICSYPKSGSHWLTNLIQLLHYEGPIEYSPPYHVALIDVFPRGNSRVLLSHFPFDRLPTEIIKRGKLVMLLRNPKDVAVSLFHFLHRHPRIKSQQSWESFVECFLHGPVMYGTYSDYIKDMQEFIVKNSVSAIHVVTYEDMKKNGVQELQKLQKFLGFNHSNERLSAILKRCSIEKMREDFNSGKVKTRLVNEKGESVVHRKVEVGDWKNHFTVAQSEAFDAIWKAKMGSSMFTFQYT